MRLAHTGIPPPSTRDVRIEASPINASDFLLRFASGRDGFRDAGNDGVCPSLPRIPQKAVAAGLGCALTCAGRQRVTAAVEETRSDIWLAPIGSPSCGS